MKRSRCCEVLGLRVDGMGGLSARSAGFEEGRLDPKLGQHHSRDLEYRARHKEWRTSTSSPPKPFK